MAAKFCTTCHLYLLSVPPTAPVKSHSHTQPLQLLQTSGVFGLLFGVDAHFRALLHECESKAPLPHWELEGCMKGHFPFRPLACTYFTRYLFSHTLLSAALAAGPFLIFMPVEAFTPARRAETPAIHLSASFKEVLIMFASSPKGQRHCCDVFTGKSQSLNVGIQSSNCLFSVQIVNVQCYKNRQTRLNLTFYANIPSK